MIVRQGLALALTLAIDELTSSWRRSRRST
jgi:hypothetical protein